MSGFGVHNSSFIYCKLRPAWWFHYSTIPATDKDFTASAESRAERLLLFTQEWANFFSQKESLQFRFVVILFLYRISIVPGYGNNLHIITCFPLLIQQLLLKIMWQESGPQFSFFLSLFPDWQLSSDTAIAYLRLIFFISAINKCYNLNKHTFWKESQLWTN